MKYFLKQEISEIMALLMRRTACPQGHRILMYHAVGGKAYRDEEDIFTITPKLFEHHMHLLQQWAQRESVAVSEMHDIGLRVPHVSISFDDGYKEILSDVCPLMEKFCFPFTVFLTADFVKDGGVRYLNCHDVQQLAQHPYITIGAHGKTHCPLTLCSSGQLREELTFSKKFLEDLLGKTIEGMSYPHGAVDERVRSTVEEVGYRWAVGSRMGLNVVEADPFLLRRTEITGRDNGRIFYQKLLGHWDWISHFRR